MAYRRRRSRGTKGKRCVRYRRVRVRGQGMARRCVKYAGRSSAKGRKRRRGFRAGHRPFNKGKRCREWGLDRRGRITCRSYGRKYSAKHKNRRRSRPGYSRVGTYENRLRKMVGGDTREYERFASQHADRQAAYGVPSWWAA